MSEATKPQSFPSITLKGMERWDEARVTVFRNRVLVAAQSLNGKGHAPVPIEEIIRLRDFLNEHFPRREGKVIGWYIRDERDCSLPFLGQGGTWVAKRSHARPWGTREEAVKALREWRERFKDTSYETSILVLVRVRALQCG